MILNKWINNLGLIFLCLILIIASIQILNINLIKSGSSEQKVNEREIPEFQGLASQVPNIEIAKIIDLLIFSDYTFIMTVCDIGGNCVSDMVVMTVVDDTAPDLNSPADITYNDGNTGNIITWVAGDRNPAYYHVSRDDRVYIFDTSWSNGSLIIDIDGLVGGIHTFIITVCNIGGNCVSDTVIVTVVDDTAPDLNSPYDIMYNVSSTGNIIIWVAGDRNPTYFHVLRDDAVYVTDTNWRNGSLIIYIDGLLEGTYSFSMTVCDGGQCTNDTVIVTVVDATDSSTPSSSLTIATGETGTFEMVILLLVFVGIGSIINRRKRKVN